jgi:hypothetical protein
VKATITRTKVAASRIGNPRVQWKWYYDVIGLGRTLSGFDSLRVAIQMAKRHGATQIIKEWEKAS